MVVVDEVCDDHVRRVEPLPPPPGLNPGRGHYHQVRPAHECVQRGHDFCVTMAPDIVLALFSAELYQALAVGRRWSHSRCTGFFREVLTAQLLDRRP